MNNAPGRPPSCGDEARRLSITKTPPIALLAPTEPARRWHGRTVAHLRIGTFRMHQIVKQVLFGYGTQPSHSLSKVGHRSVMLTRGLALTELAMV